MEVSFFLTKMQPGLGLLIGAKSASHMFGARRQPFVISRDTGLVICVRAASKGEAQGWG